MAAIIGAIFKALLEFLWNAENTYELHETDGLSVDGYDGSDPLDLPII